MEDDLNSFQNICYIWKQIQQINNMIVSTNFFVHANVFSPHDRGGAFLKENLNFVFVFPQNKLINFFKKYFMKYKIFLSLIFLSLLLGESFQAKSKTF